MTLLKRVRGFIGESELVYECRRCGTTLESAVEDCPQCGECDIAAYDLG